jgi:uncharacterized Ntn-hydrolase superfamily protein
LRSSTAELQGLHFWPVLRVDTMLRMTYDALALLIVLIGLLVGSLVGCNAPLAHAPDDVVATFSIVAYDPETQQLGIAVQSKFIAVGAVVPWAKAKVGAVATQSWANTKFGPKGLELLEKGISPDKVLEQMLATDLGRENRQVGIINAKGEAATFTGNKCMAWAGGKTGKHYAVQGNILAGKEVVDEMAKAYEESATDGSDFGERLIAALAAGQKAGGDKRGRQSAALYIVRDGWGYSGFNDRYRDLRVDDHPKPIEELARVYQLHKKVFKPRVAPEK